MKKMISVKWAGNLLLTSFGLLIIFDTLILLNFLPPNIVWAGQIKDSATKISLLTLTLFVTSIFLVIIAAKIGYIKAEKFKKVINIGVWVIFVYLILNTVGNFASDVSFENLIFAPITLVLSFCALRLAIEN